MSILPRNQLELIVELNMKEIIDILNSKGFAIESEECHKCSERFCEESDKLGYCEYCWKNLVCEECETDIIFNEYVTESVKLCDDQCKRNYKTKKGISLDNFDETQEQSEEIISICYSKECESESSGYLPHGWDKCCACKAIYCDSCCNDKMVEPGICVYHKILSSNF